MDWIAIIGVGGICGECERKRDLENGCLAAAAFVLRVNVGSSPWPARKFGLLCCRAVPRAPNMDFLVDSATPIFADDWGILQR